ncbi:MAG TPA: ATP-binding protein [Burkholderiaceae bacterium]|nr:ATP-binding protein [Burkholderiaceae bacterium]
MLAANAVLFISLVYVALLFTVAFVGDRRARRGNPGWLQSPVIYTLSISLYCTSWTFYGAVGSAARNGIEFVTIYLGPTLVFVGWWLLLRKMARIGRIHHITSIADMISSRYGKSGLLAALVTIIAVIVVTPYIALQLKAVTTSFQVISNSSSDVLSGFPHTQPDFRIAFWIAAGMAFFTILFGTRNIDANERHHGVVAAIAVEAVVKLVALLTVGLLVVFGLGNGLGDMFGPAAPAHLHNANIFGASWITQTFLAAAAVICLPRQFQMTIVECADEQHLRTASWMFPLYMLLICLFVLPIAVAGLNYLPEGSNPDMFVLTLPMWAGQDAVALLAFLGGFSSATSMVIVCSIALSTMLSNHIIMPIALRLPWIALDASGDIRRFLLNIRRASIVLILLLGFIDFRLSAQSDALASIGLISFVGVAQFLPPLIAGLFWRQATARGAITGLLAGFVVWAYTLFLPSFKGGFILSAHDIGFGVWNQALLRPQALFGLEGLDPLVHATFWSMTFNIALLVLVSLLRGQKPLERLQSTLFVDVFRTPATNTSRFVNRSATRYDLNLLAQRILGPDEAYQLFQDAEQRHGLKRDQSLADDSFISELERKLAGSVGAASARAMISQVVIGETISLYELMKIADETQRMRDYSHQLEQKSRLLEATAGQLKAANDRLTLLDSQKDDFLSQVSHEVRTPMTSIRSLSEILLETEGIQREQAERFLHIIHEESIRMTRLLDGILDLSLLEGEEQEWQLAPINPEQALDNAIRICEGLAVSGSRLLLNGARVADSGLPVQVNADSDRLNQVFINLISNALKYNISPQPYVRVSSRIDRGQYQVLVEDNGPGIRHDEREKIFLKFSRGWAQTRSGTQGAGLGLTISWQIMRRLGGTLELMPDSGHGACFRIQLPLCEQQPLAGSGT